KGNLFFYKNDKLEYVYQDTCGGELYYFEYNSSGKITKQYYGTTNFNGNTFDPNTFDLNTFKQNSNMLNYIYQGDKLAIMQYTNDFIDYQFTYNNDGKLQTAEWFLD